MAGDSGGSDCGGGAGQGRGPPAQWSEAQVQRWVTSLGAGGDSARAAAFERYAGIFAEEAFNGAALQALVKMSGKERCDDLLQASRCL